MNRSRLRVPQPEKRRILVVVRWPVGGIRTYFHYNYPELYRNGYRFTFLGPADKAFQSLRDELSKNEGTEFVEAPLQGKKCLLWGPIRRLLRTGRFDMIHSQGVLSGAQAVVANIGFGIPHVMTAHDVFRPQHGSGLSGKARLWLFGRLLRGLDALVAVGNDVRANFLEALPALDPDRVICIPNGIDTDHFADNPSTLDVRGMLGLSPQTRLLGFLGRFMEQKGFLPLLKALEILEAEPSGRQYHLVAVGSGDYEREYREEVYRRNLQSRITFRPFRPDVAPLLRGLDALVMPSLWEACPLLPMEALCAGVPVLGSDCIGLREVLSKTPAMMAPVGDPTAWALSLSEVILDPRRDEFARYAPEARRRFAVLPAARRLLELFERLTSPNPEMVPRQTALTHTP